MGGRGASSGAKAKIGRTPISMLSHKEQFMITNKSVETTVKNLKPGAIVSTAFFDANDKYSNVVWNYNEGIKGLKTHDYTRYEINVTNVKVGKKKTTVEGYYEDVRPVKLGKIKGEMKKTKRHVKKTFDNDSLVFVNKQR